MEALEPVLVLGHLVTYLNVENSFDIPRFEFQFSLTCYVI